MICAACGELKPIENRELLLCSGCNQKRRQPNYTQRLQSLGQVSKRTIAREYKWDKVRRWKEDRAGH